MEKNLYSVLAMFPTPNIEETAKFYNEVMRFRIVKYLDVKEPHICLYGVRQRFVQKTAISKYIALFIKFIAVCHKTSSLHL